MRESLKAEFAQASAELKAHMATWEYAFAMAAGSQGGRWPAGSAVGGREALDRIAVARMSRHLDSRTTTAAAFWTRVQGRRRIGAPSLTVASYRGPPVYSKIAHPESGMQER